jgi:hypothetical protein
MTYFDEQPTPYPEEREQIMKNGIWHAWMEYRLNKRIIDMAGTRFDWLKKKGYVNFSEERWETFIQKAEHEPDSINMFTRLGSGDKREMAIEIATKNIALKAFFDDLIETDTPIEHILNQ